jgi:phosphohistidine phosphatase
MPMDLILWRHAEADDGIPDTARRLTTKGEKQAEKMAAWLHARIHRPVRLLVSPATRAQQTAQALSQAFETVKELGLNSSAKRILQVTGWPDAEGTVIVVGHQPTLGQLAALLLSGIEMDWYIKKGAVWWFQSPGGDSEPVLRAAITPKHV